MVWEGRDGTLEWACVLCSPMDLPRPRSPTLTTPLVVRKILAGYNPHTPTDRQSDEARLSAGVLSKANLRQSAHICHRDFIHRMHTNSHCTSAIDHSPLPSTYTLLMQANH